MNGTPKEIGEGGNDQEYRPNGSDQVVGPGEKNRFCFGSRFPKETLHGPVKLVDLSVLHFFHAFCQATLDL